MSVSAIHNVTPIRPVTIGGSTAAAAAGVDPRHSRVMLWCELTGRIERPESEAMRWGKLLEPVVKAELRERGYELGEPPAEPYTDPDRPWCAGHPDGFWLTDDDEYALLEVKTAGQWMAGDWHGDDPPIAYAAQVQHYLHLTGLRRALLACLLGGQRLELRTMDRDQAVIDALLAAEEEFVGYVLRDEPPPPDASESSRDALAALYPRGEGVLRADKPLRVTVDELRARKAQLSSVKEQVTGLENVVKAALGDAETLIDHRDEPIVRWANVTRHAVSVERLRRERPDVYAALVETTTSRRFSVL